MTAELNQANKKLVWSFWQALDDANGDAAAGVFEQFLDDKCIWHGPDPINDLFGSTSIHEGFWKTLSSSFPDLKRVSHLFFGGQSNGKIDGTGDGKHWVGGTGYLNATFENSYIGIPATNDAVSIRWGEFCRVADGKIVEIYFLVDLIDLMQQAGIQVLPPSLGVDGLYPPPQASDGLLHERQDAAISAGTLAHIRRFIFEGLNSYDQDDVSSMGMADYFHRDVHWYGPGGIGACLSFEEFETFHQIPWLQAFPDRQVQDLDALFAEGPYSGAPGWAGVKATHTGTYKECGATGNRIAFNGLDFWKLENDQYVENWVFVDMIHLFRQFGIDLLGRIDS